MQVINLQMLNYLYLLMLMYLPISYRSLKGHTISLGDGPANLLVSAPNIYRDTKEKSRRPIGFDGKDVLR